MYSTVGTRDLGEKADFPFQLFLFPFSLELHYPSFRPMGWALTHTPRLGDSLSLSPLVTPPLSY